MSLFEEPADEVLSSYSHGELTVEVVQSRLSGDRVVRLTSVGIDTIDIEPDDWRWLAQLAAPAALVDLRRP